MQRGILNNATKQVFTDIDLMRFTHQKMHKTETGHSAPLLGQESTSSCFMTCKKADLLYQQQKGCSHGHANRADLLYQQQKGCSHGQIKFSPHT